MKKVLVAGMLVLASGVAEARQADNPSGEIQSMIDACASHPENTCIVDLHGQRFGISQTLRINPLMVSLRNGIIDASHLPDGQAAILVSSDGSSRNSYDTAANSIDHIVLTGQPKADGIVLDNKDHNDIRSAAITLENLSVSNFRRGLTIGNHAYGFGISHVQIHNNATGVYTIPHPEDAGERITFVDVGVFNNALGLDDEGGMELDWVGSRWDYNGKTAIISGLFAFDGHIEIARPSGPVIDLKALEGQVAGALYMTAGSFVLVNQSGGQASTDYWMTSTSPYSAVQFPAHTYGVKGRMNVMQGPAPVYGPSLPAFTPN